MLIDPLGKNLELNVEEWNMNIENEHELSLNFRGYSKARFKGSVYKFDCKGTIFGDNKDTSIRYLESLAFEDVVRIELDINNEKVDTTTFSVIPLNEKIEGYICILNFVPEDIFKNGCAYTMSGYYFALSEYHLVNITSYFGLGPVASTFTPAVLPSVAGGISITNDTLSVGLVGGAWTHIAIITAGGQTVNMYPTEFSSGCFVLIEEIDNGPNVAKYLINTCLDAECTSVIDMTYLIVNRGGFKLLTNVGWTIGMLGYTSTVFKTTEGYKNYMITLPEDKILNANSVLLLGNGPTSISNYESFTIDPVALFTNLMYTQDTPGNVISIGSTTEPCSASGDGTGLPTGHNVAVTFPIPGENYAIIPDPLGSSSYYAYIPVEFIINDGSLVTNIEIDLYTGYNPNTWSGTTFHGNRTTIDPDVFRNGGFAECKFELGTSAAAYYLNCGIRVTVWYNGVSTEVQYTKFTFSLGTIPQNVLDGYSPIKAALDLNIAGSDCMLYNSAQLRDGVHDIYFTYDMPSGVCVVDMGLYSSDMAISFNEQVMIDEWRTILSDYFQTTAQSLPTTMPTYSDYVAVDYNGGGLHYMEKDKYNTDPGNPSHPIFKRTVLNKDSYPGNIHARALNYGCKKISGYDTISVPLFSHIDGVHFLGDNLNALAPNIKNSILQPIH